MCQTPWVPDVMVEPDRTSRFPPRANDISKVNFKNKQMGASLVAQWLRIRLPIQVTQFQSLVREDPTCRGANKPGRHNY